MAVTQHPDDSDPTERVYPGDFVLVMEEDDTDAWPGMVVDAKFDGCGTEVAYLICRYEDGDPTDRFFRAPEHEVALHPTGRLDKTVVEELNSEKRRDN